MLFLSFFGLGGLFQYGLASFGGLEGIQEFHKSVRNSMLRTCPALPKGSTTPLLPSAAARPTLSSAFVSRSFSGPGLHLGHDTPWSGWRCCHSAASKSKLPLDCIFFPRASALVVRPQFLFTAACLWSFYFSAREGRGGLGGLAGNPIGFWRYGAVLILPANRPGTSNVRSRTR